MLGNAVLYVGQTSNVATRLAPTHEHWTAAQRRGMNAVLLHIRTTDEKERIRLETKLRGIYDPPLNKQDRPIATTLMKLNRLTEPDSGAFGERPKGLGIGLLGAFDTTLRRN